MKSKLIFENNTYYIEEQGTKYPIECSFILEYIFQQNKLIKEEVKN